MTTQRRVPELQKLPPEPGKRPYALRFPGVRWKVFCTVEELQALADQLNDELDSIVQ